MARQLVDINQSGELADIKLGNTGADDSVTKKGYVDQQDALKVDKTTLDALQKLTFDPNAPTPSPAAEGQLFYDSESKSLSYKLDVLDVTLNIGQEVIIRVFNNTGQDIFDGQACYETGVDPATFCPTVALAQADSLATSRVLGIATHDIPNSTVGVLTVFGAVRAVDTTGWTEGAPLYLSESSPGALTPNPPEITSQVGMCIIEAAVSGEILVNIVNNISLPTGIGILSGNGSTYTASITPQDITGYDTEASKILEVDKVAGAVHAQKSGFYRVMFTATMSFPTATQTRQIDITLIEKISGATYLHAVPIARDIDRASVSLTVPIQTGLPIETFVAQISSPDNISGVTFDAISFSAETINIT